MNDYGFGKDGLAGPKTAGGTEYLTMVVGATQGTPEEDVWRGFNEGFIKWLNGRDPANVVWRVRPHFCQISEDRVGVRCRMAWEEPQ